MAENKKSALLTFARAFQNAYRGVALYGADHASAQGHVTQAYTQLTELLKHHPHVALGFMNGRAMLNDLMSKEASLVFLQGEFDRRGVGMVRFSPGLRMEDFKHAMAVVTAKRHTIDEAGGLEVYVRNNFMDAAQVIPATQLLRQAQDAMLHMGSGEATAPAAPAGTAASAGLQGLNMLLQSSGKEEGLQVRPDNVLELMENAVQSAVSEAAGKPAQAVAAIARILDEMKPAFVLAALPQSRQHQLAGKSNQETATELAEDIVAHWAAAQATAAPGGEGAEHVAAGLARALAATDAARLMAKVTGALRGRGVSEQDVEHIKHEIEWMKLSSGEKMAALLRLEKYSDQEFQRLQSLVATQIAMGASPQAGELVTRYLTVCEAEGLTEQNLMRGTDLLALFSDRPGMEVLRPLLPRFRSKLSDGSLDSGTHHEIVSCLTIIARAAAPIEDYETVIAIGRDLEASAAADRATHGICCAASAAALVSKADAERIVDRVVHKREDATFVRTATAMLRYSGTDGAEAALSRLETEETPQNRKLLMRLIGQLGTSALDAARLRLKSQTWYVVRNVCTVLQELRDPDLAQHLRPALIHDDVRVQQAAFTALTKARAAGRAEVIANSLPSMHAQILESALDEIAFLKDPKSLPGMVTFVSFSSGRSPVVMMKAVAALKAIGGPGSAEGLGRVLRDAGAPKPARLAALEALRWSMLPEARKQVQEFSSSWDPLAREYAAKAGH